MKKNIKTIAIALLLAGGIGLTACLSVGSQDSEQVMQERPAVSSVTMNHPSALSLMVSLSMSLSEMNP